MGLNYHLAGEILAARTESGAASIATIGQLQHFMSPKQARDLCREHGLPAAADWTGRLFGSYGPEFFSAIGCKRLTVFDASAYEGADVVHDMNEPVSAEHHQQYDIVVDGGSIEHIFRPDQTLANIMRMVRVGGSAIIWTPANNLCGHGFYQFSPEFFYSALRSSNGFDITAVRLVECRFPSVSLVPSRAVYDVRSPREIRDRVGVVSRRPLMMLVRATKLEHLDEPFERTPQQSDYEDHWASDAPPTGARIPGRRMPEPAQAALAAAIARVRHTHVGSRVIGSALGLRELRRDSLRNRRYFSRVG